MWRRQTTLQKQKRRTQKRTEKKKFCGQSMTEYELKPKGLYFKWKCGSQENYRKFLDEQELPANADPSPARTSEFQLEGDQTYYYATPNGWDRMTDEMVSSFTNAFETSKKNSDWINDVDDELVVKRLNDKIYFHRKDNPSMWIRVVQLPYSEKYKPIILTSDLEPA